MKRYTLTILFVFSLGLISCASDFLISEIDAVHLAQRQINSLTVASVQTYIENHTPIYEIYGSRGSSGFCAKVDANCARVIEVTRDGKPYYRWEGPVVIGHRGNVKFTPENTIPAFLKAVELGADLIEIDIRETKDGHLVIVHDSTVDRTTDGSGPVTNFTLDELKQLDAGSWFSPEFKDTRIPTLKEALDAIAKAGALPDLDFKAGTPAKLIQEINEAGLLGKVTMYCGDWDLLKETMQQTNQFQYRPSVPLGVLGLPRLMSEINPPIVNIDWMEFSERLVREIHLLGKKSMVNTMQHDTDYGMIKMLETKPDYIQSDHLDILVPMLRARGWHK